MHTTHKHVPATCIPFLPSLIPGSSRHLQLVWLTAQLRVWREAAGQGVPILHPRGSPWCNMHSSGLGVMRGAGYSLSFFSFPPSSPSHTGRVGYSLVPRPGRRRKEGLVPIARACTNYPKKTDDIASYPRRERRAKKHTVVHGTPGFLGVVGHAHAISTRPFLLPLGPRVWVRG